MYFPLTIVDNFFDDFDYVLKLATSLPYAQKERHYVHNNTWHKNYTMPGSVTKPLHEIQPDYFRYSTEKILSLFYNRFQIHDTPYKCLTKFEKIVPYGNEYDKHGFVHSDDDNMLSCLFYIQGDQDEGTSFFKFKKSPAPDTFHHMDIKEKLYGGEKVDPKLYNKMLAEHNSSYDLILEVPFIPNRAIVFDSSHFHASNGYGSIKKNRIIQTFFFSEIKAGSFPIPEKNRVSNLGSWKASY